MAWLNIYGLIAMIIIMIPNVIFAMKEKNFESKYNNKVVELIEQIGRFGSMGLMIFNIPLLDYGYWFTKGKVLYVSSIAVLSILYCFVWFLYFQKASIEKAILLAIIPTILFLLSGIIQGKVLLILSAILFGITHIIITYYNNR
ncbi:hypothetical protein [Terrisporobacter mayombei]|uniref:Transporter n=1 Tax=Terrisporobacter mayombei TaxID=1541 RepID=A0ABY9Q2R7_9FIRM|nr:hypothetical protein [Terrisporobacter mayombei]MCC3866642.1 hypothetical protein [Terrisporobacter mayombei]WMT80877.1 hypothetical protein TEMA_11990 [Terrisporobacter mayombei]